MTTFSRSTALLALISGGLLVVDTVTVTVINGSFGTLDDVLFLGGLVLLVATDVAFAVDVSRSVTGRRRVGLAVAAFLGLAVVLGAVSWVADTVGRHVFAPTNVGLHGEWSFFSVGVCLLLLAGWANRRQASASSSRTRGTTTVP